MDNFYVILPSNSCPQTHPNNHASQYTVSWENPLDLEDTRWKVALTEIVYYHAQMTTNDDFAVKYEQERRTKFRFKVLMNIYNKTGDFAFTEKGVNFPAPQHGPADSFSMPRVTVDTTKNNHILLESDFEFKIFFNESAHHFGFENGMYPSVWYDEHKKYLIYSTNPTRTLNLSYFLENIEIELTSHPYTVNDIITLDGERYMKDPMAAMLWLNEVFKKIFSISLQDNKKVLLQLRPNTKKVQLCHGLNIMLGFSTQVFRSSNAMEFKADYEPQMKRGVNNMYIYANICQPIQVGDVRVPLLKNLWLDVQKREYNFGEVCSKIIRNPMYIPVASTSINSIEVNIRSDSGRLFPFIEGAVTSLTLHFKKDNHG